MGSSGSGRISDYPGSSKGGKGSGGGNGKEDRCAKAFDAILEDVEHSDYYKKSRKVPPVGTKLRVAVRKRLVAETEAGESVGNLPTKLNYLAACIKEGWSYRGLVTKSGQTGVVARVSADFGATAP